MVRSRMFSLYRENSYMNVGIIDMDVALYIRSTASLI